MLAHHYREDWEWHDGDLDAGTRRYERWVQTLGASQGSGALAAAREALDEDLNTPAALAAIDAAAAAGEDVSAAAQLLGVSLSA